MAGDHGAEELNLKGFSKYYNTYTIIGRRNIALSTYGMLLLGVLYYKFKPKSIPKEEVVVVETKPVAVAVKKH